MGIYFCKVPPTDSIQTSDTKIPLNVCELFLPIPVHLTSFILVYTCSLVLSTSFNSFIIYQSFLLVYESFLLVSTHLSDVSTRLPVVSHFNAYKRTMRNF